MNAEPNSLSLGNPAMAVSTTPARDCSAWPAIMDDVWLALVIPLRGDTPKRTLLRSSLWARGVRVLGIHRVKVWPESLVPAGANVESN